MHLFCIVPLTMGHNGCITIFSYSDKRYSVNKNEVKQMNITTKVKTDLIEAVAIHNEIAKLTAKLEAFKTEYRGKLSPEQEITLDTGEHMKKGKTYPAKRGLKSNDTMQWLVKCVEDNLISKDDFDNKYTEMKSASKERMTIKQTSV